MGSNMHSSAAPELVAPPAVPLRGVDLGVAWESPWQEFRESLRDFMAGPRPLKDSELQEPLTLRVHWIRGAIPGKGLAGSVAWHVVLITLAVLPIWGFLPAPEQTLAPVQIESTLYYVPPDLPKLELHRRSAHPDAKPAPVPAKEPAKTDAQKGADAFHPRQTILSAPVKVTHPRQTLIQPHAPAAPPKVVEPIPNIVQWAATAPQAPRLQLAPTAAAPQMRQRTTRDVAAPVVADDKNAAPIAIAQNSTNVRMPVSPMSAARAAERQARTQDAAAPDVAASSGDTNLRRLIALSAAPAPPAPVVSIPQGNLAARIAISPEGTKPGTPGGTEHGSASATGSAHSGASSATGLSSAGGGAAGADSLPAAISIRGGIAPSSNRAARLNLNPSLPPNYTTQTRKGPLNVAAIDPGLPPEKILSGKEVYTIDVNMPNLTSVAGSWVLYFAELNEDETPPFRIKGKLSSPVPLEKVDPKYPPEAIKEHIDGQVVLYAIIRKDGSVDSIQLVHGIDPQLDHNAIEALGKWKFTPGARDGVPVDLEAVVQIPFRFRDPNQ